MTRRSTLLAAVALVGALLGCEHAVAGTKPATAKKGAPPAQTAATPTPAAATPAPVAKNTDEVPRVTPQEAAAAVAAGTAIIVDVREDAPWDAAHVKGALHLSLREIEANHLDTLPRDKRIIAYCS